MNITDYYIAIILVLLLSLLVFGKILQILFCSLFRCLFQITRFIQDYHLTLRAASWITVVNDAYARYYMIKSGQVEWDICSGQPNYQIPCPKPGAFVFAKARVTSVNAGVVLDSSRRLYLLSFLLVFSGLFSLL